MSDKRSVLLATVLGLGACCCAIATPAFSTQNRPTSLLTQSTRMTRPTIPLDGKPVYVQHNGRWREARLMGWSWNSSTGERYKVLYLDNNRTEEGVGRDRIRSLAEAQRAGISTNPYDLSSQAGITQMLEAHNQLRARVRIPSLRWSPQLATYAQQWAEKLLAEDRFEHRPNSPYGENLAFASGQQLSPDRVVGMWGSEASNYNYATNRCAPGKVCGHYTQIVWKNTTEVGCGMARGNGREIWVCNYNPPGNVVGQKPY
jgi:pathogenesis-related protein 1